MADKPNPQDVPHPRASYSSSLPSSAMRDDALPTTSRHQHRITPDRKKQRPRAIHYKNKTDGEAALF